MASIIRIITNDDCLNEKWFIFRMDLGLDIQQLHQIESTSKGTLHCTRKVLCEWRAKNHCTELPWKPIAEALVKVGLSGLAHEVKDFFTNEQMIKMENEKGWKMYCQLCDCTHIKYTVNDING